MASSAAPPRRTRASPITRRLPFSVFVAAAFRAVCGSGFGSPELGPDGLYREGGRCFRRAGLQPRRKRRATPVPKAPFVSSFRSEWPGVSSAARFSETPGYAARNLSSLWEARSAATQVKQHVLRQVAPRDRRSVSWVSSSPRGLMPGVGPLSRLRPCDRGRGEPEIRWKA